jgi:hypothetical protein
MNILILHSMGNPRKWLRSVATFELGLPQFDASHNYLVHNSSLPLPKFVQEFRFDMIIMNSSFMTSVFDRHRLTEMKENYGFLKNSDAFKVALPQDDYYCSEELDKTVTDWGIDLLFTVCPKHWDILYPRFTKTNGKLLLGYTGYITPEILAQSVSPKPRKLRTIDISYRASGKPTFPNKLATIKAQIGDIFLENFLDQSWSLDISSKSTSFISGTSWWDFLENSRCVLGSMSGSSNLIRNHETVDKIRTFQSAFPDASDDEIIYNCIPLADTSNIYEAISPRVIEAALLNSVQILVKGDYSDILVPYQDYLPIAGDFLNGKRVITNTQEIKEIINSPLLQEKTAFNCREKLLSFDRLRIENFFKQIFKEQQAFQNSGYITNKTSFSKMNTKYNLLMRPLYAIKFQAGNSINLLKQFKKK